LSIASGLLCGGRARCWLSAIRLIGSITRKIDAFFRACALIGRRRRRCFECGTHANNQQQQHQNTQTHHDVLTGSGFGYGFFTLTRATL
jgi:hypothetical protein